MYERLFGFRHAFDHPVTVWITAGTIAVLLVAPLLILLATRRHPENRDAHRELWQRYRSWLLIAPCMIVPVLLGAAWTIVAILVLALLCYREFARMTGSFRDREVSVVVVLGTLLSFFAVLDHWYALFVAAWPLTVGALAIVALVRDEPKGYVQRLALGVLGFMLFGVGLGHLAYFANDASYRPILLMLIAGIQLNDVFAFCSGKLFGRRKLMPHTSPNKTWGGSLGALVCTTALVVFLAHHVFAGTSFDHLGLLVGFGLIVSVIGQLGDLMLSAIKRDVGVKDTGHLIPGHGGLLDRFDSSLLVGPAAFHFIGYFVGIGLTQTTRIMTG